MWSGGTQRGENKYIMAMEEMYREMWGCRRECVRNITKTLNGFTHAIRKGQEIGREGETRKRGKKIQMGVGGLGGYQCEIQK